MTLEQQIEAYKALRNNGQAFFINDYQQADRVIEALEKLEKYRLHDLRKDPEDLPADEMAVIVYLNGRYGFTNYKNGAEECYYIPGEGFTDDPEKEKLVIGWRMIELWEEGE